MISLSGPFKLKLEFNGSHWLSLPLNWKTLMTISQQNHTHLLYFQYFVSQFNSDFRNFCCKNYTESCFVAEFQWPKGMKLIQFPLRLQTPVFILVSFFIHGCNHDKKLRIKKNVGFSITAGLYAYLIYRRYFAQNSTGSCERCHKSCKECTGPRATDCLSCNTYFYLLHATNECVSSCPQYYYENKDNNICERCHSSCLTCDGKSICSALSKKKGSSKHLESQLHDLGTLHKDTNPI